MDDVLGFELIRCSLNFHIRNGFQNQNIKIQLASKQTEPDIKNVKILIRRRDNNLNFKYLRFQECYKINI